MILQPNEIRQVGSANARFLLIRRATKSLELSADRLAPTRIEQGDSVDIGEFDNLTISNPHDTAIEVDFQTSSLRLSTQNNNETTVSEIKAEIRAKINDDTPVNVNVEDSTPVNVQVTDQVLKTREQVNTGLMSPDWITLEPNTQKQLVTVNPNRKEVLIQNISENEASANLGDAAVNESKGLPVTGSRETPAGMVLNTSAAVFAFNTSDVPVTFAIAEIIA
ncbi:hypothetical protein MHO82_24550 [Vibrio sp. Of7-15]|uniref:hypothetical protein n=1 Tax=Vibrio sp. Of7-15 TaxID=2724879 RepID=UPI001EF34550|nr:hypothetical protein [Vibrio sp. Of7-15]MCG7500038.1 hypothetical protein [Vibrio sp. Of7-15]